MKIVLVKPEKLLTNFDNKKTEIKKYMESLDFEQTNNKDTNLLKRVALLLLNEEEIGQITVDYKNNLIEYKSNIEYLLAAKILKQDSIVVKVMSNEEEFINKYSAIPSNIQSIDRNVGFINWEEKNKVTVNDWNDIDFLKERINLTSFETVLEELIAKKSDFHLSKEFLEFIQDEYSSDYFYEYFSRLNNEELKSSVLIEVLKQPITSPDKEHFFNSYFTRATGKEDNRKDKDLTSLIKDQLINEHNLKTIFKKENIAELKQYLPAKFRSHEHIVECVVQSMRATGRYGLSLDEGIKLVGRKYLENKKNFVFFIEAIGDLPMRTNDFTDKIIKDVTESFDMNDEQDKRYVNYLMNQAKFSIRNEVLTSILSKITMHNLDKLDNKEKLNLFAKEFIVLEEHEVLAMTKNEDDFEVLLNNRNRITQKVIQTKIKEIDNVENFFTKKENIVKFLRLSFDNHWLKSKIVPQSWKNNDELLIETYGTKNYCDLPLAKRKEIEDSKDNILKLIQKNQENFSYIRSEEKYDTSILKYMAYDDAQNFEEILKEIPSKKWFNFNFTLSMLEYNPQALEYIPKALFDNKQFTLSVFDMYENHNSYNMAKLLDKIPSELKSFLQENNIRSNYVKNLTNHFLKDSLEVTLVEKNSKEKKMKI